MGGRLVGGLRRYLRNPLTLAEARATLRCRLERREADFLALARDAVFANPRSPYRALLRLAGCEYGDLERLVRRDGVEGALRALLRQGVYLTVDEFKGRRRSFEAPRRSRAGRSFSRTPWPRHTSGG